VQEAAPVNPLSQLAATNPELRDIGKTLAQYNQQGTEAAERLAEQTRNEPPKTPVDQNFTDRTNDQQARGRDGQKPRI
jgi:hypothetical protein